MVKVVEREARSSGGPVINVTGERVALGPIRKDLLALYTRWVNDLDAARMLEMPPGPMTEEKELEWFEGQAKAEDSMAFTIYERENLQPIGNTSLFEVDYRNSRATFGILIGEPEFRNKGYGTETTRLMLDYAFAALGLHSVMLTVFEFNPAGLRAYQKAGFKEFGRRRECRRMGGKLYDEIYMDCLASEFERPVTPGKEWGLSAWLPLVGDAGTEVETGRADSR